MKCRFPVTAALAVAIHATSGCAWMAEIGPTYADAQAVAEPSCNQPLVPLPDSIDRNVRAISLTGRWDETLIAPLLFGDPAYAFIETELEATRPDGTRFIRYAKAGSSRLVNRVQTCPDGTLDLGPHPLAPWQVADPPRACVTMRPIVESTTRWQVRRTIDGGADRGFRRQVTTDEIVDAHDGGVRGGTRHVSVDTERERTTTAMIGIFPVVSRSYRVNAACGRTLRAVDVLRLLPPSARKSSQ